MNSAYKKISVFALLLICLLTGLWSHDGHTADMSTSLWSIRCDQAGKGQWPYCEAFQRLTQQGSQKRQAEFAVGFPQGGQAARGIVILPADMLLDRGVAMQIDQGAPFNFRMRYCNTDGCFAFLDLNHSVLNMMRQGQALKITYMNVQSETVHIEMPLSGFAHAVAKISSS